VSRSGLLERPSSALSALRADFYFIDVVDSKEGEVTNKLEALELEAQMDPEAPSAQYLPYSYLIGIGDF